MPTLNFNASEVEPNIGFHPVPAGKYIAVITDSEMKDTRSGTGRYLQLEFEITEGEYRGRKLWSRLNLENPNPEAVRMARGDLSAICRAVNVLTPKDSIELHNLQLEITVRCKNNQDGEITNEIKGYGAQARPQAVPPPQTGSNTQPPWAKGR